MHFVKLFKLLVGNIDGSSGTQTADGIKGSGFIVSVKLNEAKSTGNRHTEIAAQRLDGVLVLNNKRGIGIARNDILIKPIINGELQILIKFADLLDGAFDLGLVVSKLRKLGLECFLGNYF